MAPERGGEVGLAAETVVEGRAEPKMDGPVTVQGRGIGPHQAAGKEGGRGEGRASSSSREGGSKAASSNSREGARLRQA